MLHVEIERDQRKRNIGLISKLPIDQDEWPMQLSAPTAAHLKQTNCGRAERTICHESHMSCEILHAGLGITFIGTSHLPREVRFPASFAKMHFLCCLDKTETQRPITA